jgi:hypothetical protein
VEGNQTSGENFGDLGLVVPPLIDANSGNKNVPERLVNSLFHPIAFVRHLVTPFWFGGSEDGFGKS